MRSLFEYTSVYNFKNAMRGMRNPKNSWAKNDTYETVEYIPTGADGTGHPDIKIIPHIGPNDMDLATRLISAGSEHRKFLQQLFICVDITLPREIWQEADTYRVGVTKNSCSTMHKIQDHLLDETDFEDGIDPRLLLVVNEYVKRYRDSKAVSDLELLKKQLPEGFLQKRTVTMNYENVMNIFRQRMHHRMPHWRVDFCKWALTLPYMREFLLAAGIIDENYEPKE